MKKKIFSIPKFNALCSGKCEAENACSCSASVWNVLLSLWLRNRWHESVSVPLDISGNEDMKILWCALKNLLFIRLKKNYPHIVLLTELKTPNTVASPWPSFGTHLLSLHAEPRHKVTACFCSLLPVLLKGWAEHWEHFQPETKRTKFWGQIWW